MGKLPWLYAFIAFAFIIEPKLFTQYRATVLIFAAGNIGVFAFTLFFLRKKISPYLICWVIYRSYVFAVMMINGNLDDVDQWGYLSLMVANLILVSEYYTKQGKLDDMLSAGAWVCIIYLAINAVTLLIYENGIITSTEKYTHGDGDYFFLGIKTAFTLYVFAALSFSGLYAYRKRKLLPFVLASALSLFNVIFKNISTGKICLAVFVISLFVGYTFKIKIPVKIILSICFLMSIAVVLFGVQNYFESFIVEVLNKRTDLTGRTEIWQNAIEQIYNGSLLNFVFGSGIVNNGSFVLVGAKYWPAHNQWIQTVFEEGVVGTLILMFYLSQSDRFHGVKRFETIFLTCMIFSIFVGNITMRYMGNPQCYVPFVLLYCLGKYERNVFKECKPARDRAWRLL